MKKFAAVLFLACMGAAAQIPPPLGAFTFNGTSWVAAASTSLLNLLTTLHLRRLSIVRMEAASGFLLILHVLEAGVEAEPFQAKQLTSSVKLQTLPRQVLNQLSPMTELRSHLQNPYQLQQYFPALLPLLLKQHCLQVRMGSPAMSHLRKVFLPREWTIFAATQAHTRWSPPSMGVPNFRSH